MSYLPTSKYWHYLLNKSTMITLPLAEREQHEKELIEAFLDEQLVCFPTDSLYGLGGVVSPGVVARIETCKERLPGKHYSVIAPDRAWIEAHFDIPNNLDQLRQSWFTQHGPLTILLTKKDPEQWAFLSPTPRIGVRWLPHHPVQWLIQKLWQPIVATSCNRSGLPPICSPNELHDDVFLNSHIAYFLTQGTLPGPASTLIDPQHPENVIKRS